MNRKALPPLGEPFHTDRAVNIAKDPALGIEVTSDRNC